MARVGSGGVGIVALWLRDTKEIRAGNAQLIFDLGVFARAFALFDWQVVLLFLVREVVLNVMVIILHRRDHYMARR